jgi:hypothetical protein
MTESRGIEDAFYEENRNLADKKVLKTSFSEDSGGRSKFRKHRSKTEDRKALK